MRIVCLVFLVGLAAPAAAQETERIQLPGTLEGLPFSSAVRVGDLLFLSGQIGIDPQTGQLVPGGIGMVISRPQ